MAPHDGIPFAMNRRAPRPYRLLTSLVAVVTAMALVAGCSRIGADEADPSRAGSTRGARFPATPTEPGLVAELAAPNPSLLKAGRGTLEREGLKVASLQVDRQMPGLAYSLDIVRGQILRQHHWAGGGAMTLMPTLVASSSKVVAVSITATAGSTTSTAVVYYDPLSNHSYASPALIAPPQWERFVTMAAELTADQRDRAVAQLKEPTFPNGVGPALGFSANGDLVVLFQPVDGAAIPPVAIAGDDAASLLTPLGTFARASARYPTAALTPDRFARSDPALVGTAPAPTATPGTTGTPNPTGTPNVTGTPGATPAPSSDPRPPLVLGTDCTVAKCVVLTFDDGPLPQTTEVLDQLNALKAPATFFMLGTSVDEYPKVVTQVAANGMEVASHNQRHNDMSRTGEGLLTKQVSMAASNLRALTGADPLFLRPPYGGRNRHSDRIVGKQGMAVALWSVDTLDWAHSKDSPSAAQAAILTTVTKQIGNGGVVLMHDIHGNSRASTTAVVTQLREQGYTLVTLAELAPADYRFGKAFCSSLALRDSCVG